MSFAETDPIEPDDSFLPIKRKSQKALKRAKKAAACLIAVDPKPFNALGVSVPVTRPEAEELVRNILEMQKAFLEVSPCYFLQRSCIHQTSHQSLLASLCNTRIREALKLSIVSQHTEQIIPVVNSSTTTDASDAPATEETPAAFPAIQPMKSFVNFI